MNLGTRTGSAVRATQVKWQLLRFTERGSAGARLHWRTARSPRSFSNQVARCQWR